MNTTIVPIAALRGYQIDDKKAILDAWKEFRSVLYQLPTGGGKSVILASIIEDLKDKKIIVFAHKKKLIKQLSGHLRKRGIDVGIMMGTESENLDANIIIASIRTAVKDSRLQMLIDREWDYEFIDEARHSRTGSYDKVLEEIFHNHPNAKLLGVDATPYRKDKKRLDHHYQTLVCSKETTASLMEKGFLQKCKTIVSPIELDKLEEEVKETTGDYQVQALSYYMRKPKFLEYVVSQYITYGEGRQNIVFAVDIQHAKKLQQVFEDNGFEGKVARVDSTMSDVEVEKAFKDFEDGTITHLINVEMVTEGVDLPIAGCVTGARPTKSLTLYLQMGGRGGRPDGENDYFILLDCCGWTAEYGTIASPKTWSLNPEIDPNGGRSGYKVFRANNDGKLEEVNDDFIGEVIELSPEEYLQQLAGGKDQAEAINVSIDDKIAALFQEIIKMLAKMMKELNDQKDFNVTYNYEYSDKKIIWTHKSGSDNSWRSNQFSLSLRKGRDPQVRLENTDSDTASAYFQTLRFAGKLGESVLQMITDKKTSGMTEMMEQVERLQKSKIDMEQFKKAEAKMAAEQRETEINEHARLDGTFIFNTSISYNSYFKHEYGVDNVKGLILNNGKINGHHNTITLIAEHLKWNSDERKYIGEEKRFEKKYVKGDKILEMIEDGKWNIEVEAKA